MKKHNSIITFLLLLGMLSTTACGSASDDADTEAAGTTSAAEVSDPNKPDIEPCDYGGKDFHVFAPAWSLYKTSFFADEESGDIMNDAVYERRRLTEEYLNVSLKHTIEGDVMKLHETIRPIVMAGEDRYQMILTHFFHCVAPILTDGLLYDQNDIATIDFSKPYWNTLVNENLSVDGKQYYSSSDFILSETVVLLFNKDMVADYKFESPYDLVRRGDWTLDQMITMAESVTKDLNGDTEIDITDQLGLTGEYWRLCAFLSAGDVYLAAKDDSTGLRLTLNSERMVKLTEKFDHLLNGTAATATWKVNPAAGTTNTMDMGTTLFQMEELANFYKYRETDVDFGIVPLPKFDKAQAQHYAIELSGFIGVPATVSDPDLAGKVMEMLSYYSGETTQPVYFDKVLDEKLSRDEDSKEMLSLIFNSMVVDPGRVWFGNGSAMGNLFYTLGNGIQNGESFASWYAKYESAANGEIKSFMDAVRSLG